MFDFFTLATSEQIRVSQSITVYLELDKYQKTMHSSDIISLALQLFSTLHT